MRRRALALTLVVFCGGSALSGEVLVDQTLDSPSLGKPMLYNIYLPDRARADQRFPAVYLLHGFGGGRGEWLAGADLATTLDRMIATGRIAPMIAVMPEAGVSWYVDSARFGGPGDYETAIVRDLVPGIDAAYPTIADAQARAIAGHSMGGHGALRLAFGHPALFSAVAALSPSIFKPGGVSWRTGPASGDAEQREKWFPKTTGESFDIEVFKAQSPFARIAGVAAREPPMGILLAVGDDDYWSLQDGTVEMYIELRRAGLKPELRVGDGGHDWRYWRSVVPALFSFLDAQWRPPAAPE